MSLTDQLQSALSAATALEQQLVTLSLQVQSLTTTNADLLAKLTGQTKVGDSPAPADTLEWGFVANDNDSPAAIVAALKRMKADGGSWLRLWHSHFGALSANNVAAINAAAAQGLRVILCVQPKDGEAKNLGAPDIAGFITKNRATLAKVHYVEAGNELNLNQYRPDDLGGSLSWHKPYVQRWLAPLHAALSPLNVKTLCTSITDTYHPDTYAQQYDLLQAAGAIDHCDGVAIHAYFLPQNLQMLSTILGRLKQTWNKPIHVTECNVQTKNLTPAQWLAQFPPYLDTLRQAGVGGIAFYRGFPKTTGGWTWPTLFDATGKAMEVYAQLLSALK